jgi:hypothetical protein
MAGISALNPYGTYNPLRNYLASGRTSGLTGGYAPELGQLDSLFGNLKLIANYTNSLASSQRAAYKTQVKDFAGAAKNLAGSAKSLLNLPDPAGTDAKIATVKDFVAKYNTLNATLNEADNLTAKGRGLLGTLQAAASVRADDLGSIGIAYNKNSGELAVDELKLQKAVATDYAKVKETLSGGSGLAAAVDKTLGAAAREPVGGYLAAPATASTGYTRLLKGINASSYYNTYSQGMLLDLIV